jgi:hypothetical protein
MTLEIAAAWVIAAILVGIHAGRRGRSALAWFAQALLVSPPLSWLILLALPDDSPEARHAIARVNLKQCPHCTMWIRCEAVRCRHCHMDQPAESVRQPDYSHLPNRSRRLATLAFAGLLFVVALIAILTHLPSSPVPGN